jgi:ABC-type multidrug transport system ATPase subunit
LKLELINIGKRYHKAWLFRHVNMGLASGESLSITGRNGSGKSTLMQIIYGLVQPGEGNVLMDGKAIENPHIHFAYTSPYMELPMEFSMRELHQLYVDTNKTQMDFEAFLFFSEFTLEQSEKSLKLFSSGMLQRFKTALCLSSNAEICLLDEPLTNMDKFGELWYKNCVESNDKRILIVAGNQETEYAFTQKNLQIGA